MTGIRRSPTPALSHQAFYTALQQTEEGSEQWHEHTSALLCLRLIDSWWQLGATAVELDALAAIKARQSIAKLGRTNMMRLTLLGILNLMQTRREPAIWTILPRLQAFADLLEMRGSYLLAADVYATITTLGDEERDGDLVNDCYLRLAFCLRETGSFEDAHAYYHEGRDLAAWHGDKSRVLTAEIGLANLARIRGDLPAADKLFDFIVERSAAQGFQRVEALALQEQAIVAQARKDSSRAACLAYRALELQTSSREREQLIGNIGAYLIALGCFAAARSALLIQEATATVEQNRTIARINLLALAARTRDRRAFDLYRARLTGASMTLGQSVNLGIEIGRGLFAFGEEDSARAELGLASAAAYAAGLNRAAFEADELIAIGASRKTSDREPASVPASVAHVENGLRQLAGAIVQQEP